MNGILFITIVITFVIQFLVTRDAILNSFFSMSRLSLYYIWREKMFVSLDLCLGRQQGISPYICSMLLGREKEAKIWLFDTKSVKREVREKDVGQTSNGPFSLQGVSFSWSETDTEREGGILSFKFRLQQSDKWSSNFQNQREEDKDWGGEQGMLTSSSDSDRVLSSFCLILWIPLEFNEKNRGTETTKISLSTSFAWKTSTEPVFDSSDFSLNSIELIYEQIEINR